MKKQYRFILFFLCLILIPFSFLLLLHVRHPQNTFSSFSKELFVNEMLSDSLSMHYTISNPKKFGIPSYQVTLPLIDKSSYITQGLSLENYIKALNQMDLSNLSTDEIFQYKLLKSNLEQQLKGEPYFYYYEPFRVNSGTQSQLPILLSEYTFYTKKDVRDYFTLLSEIPAYYDSLIEYEGTRSKLGFFMPTESADKIILQCSEILNPTALKDNSHFLITSFQERLEVLQKSCKLSNEEIEAYKKENLRLLTESVLPSYQHLSSFFIKSKKSAKNQLGLCYFEKGRNYYSYLLKQATGSDKSIDSLKILLQNRLRDDYNQIDLLNRKIKDMKHSVTSIEFPLTTPEEMVDNLKTQMENDFPPFPSMDEKIMNPNYEIKYVSPAMRNYVSPAFYLTPPIDNMTCNTIYINPGTKMNFLELYTTLAHEGYPGHLYQTVYFESYEQSQCKNPIRNILYYGGYVEGWALYVENLSYEYAKNVISSTSNNDFSNNDYRNTVIDLYRMDRDFQICLYSILDIAIHYDGINYEEAHSMLSEFGIVDEDTGKSIFSYILEEPTNYLKYYIGYLELLELKADAKEQLGENYKDSLFHQFVLEAGPMDFPILKSYLTLRYKNYNLNNNKEQSIRAAQIFLKNIFNCFNAFSNTSFSCVSRSVTTA